MQEGLKVAAVGGSSEPEQSAQVRAQVQVADSGHTFDGQNA